jgi:hypothetical protein
MRLRLLFSRCAMVRSQHRRARESKDSYSAEKPQIGSVNPLATTQAHETPRELQSLLTTQWHSACTRTGVALYHSPPPARVRPPLGSRTHKHDTLHVDTSDGMHEESI